MTSVAPKPQQERCPPHLFEAAWQGTEENSTGVIFCRYCGDIRALEVARVPAPEMESEGAVFQITEG